MAGSSFGKNFNITTWGESHGKGLGVVIQGCPPGIKINENMLQAALDKRKTGSSIASTSRKEPDQPLIMSGVFNGLTTGTPIMIMIFNKDADSKAYDKNADVFRPGHGDITYHQKYGIRDFRGGGRSSARETAARVAAGAVAQLILDRYDINILTYTIELGGVHINETDLFEVNNNPFQCPDKNCAALIEEKVKKTKKNGDSLGGIIEIKAVNVPPGLGEPVFDKLDAEIAKGLMSIGAVKAVEIGAGVQAPKMTGYENNDQINTSGFETNHSGGILAGISNGDDIIARVHVKPIPSILKEQRTVDENGKETRIVTEGRHDICAIPRINSVCQSMMAIVLADHLLRQKTNRLT